MNQETIQYIINFLLLDSANKIGQYVFYGKKENCPNYVKVIVVKSNFFDEGIYGTSITLPKIPFECIPNTNTPFLFGNSLLEQDESGRFVLHADLIASSYFMLSRYEEIIKTDCRDQHGRFLAKDSVVFQQGYGLHPLVDEWGLYLRNLLRKAGIELPEEKHGFTKIYLTHDVDDPFLFCKKKQVVKQWIKNLIHYGKIISHPLIVYRTGKNDPFYSFPQIIEFDNSLKKELGNIVESIYFVISAGNKKSKRYCNIELPKYQRLLKELNDSGATIGLHVSYEGGGDPQLLETEFNRMKKYCQNSTSKSRHHYLRWTEPGHIGFMEAAGITEDFTLGYADSVGFRVGTCRPYRFINPRTKQISNVIEHPMQIMECSLDANVYMNLDYEKARDICFKIIKTVYKHNGELNLLFHNNQLADDDYFNPTYSLKLYKELLLNLKCESR